VWTKEAALDELKRLADQTHTLSGKSPSHDEHVRWWANTMRVLEEVFGGRSRYYLSVAQLRWYETGSFIVQGYWNVDEERAKRHQEAYERDLGAARGLLLAAIDHLDSSDVVSVYEGKDTPPESSAIVRVINLAEHKLRKTIRDAPTREKEVQDAFENLLIGADLSYSRETERIEYSSKTYTPDFTMMQIDLAIEIKLCGRDGRERNSSRRSTTIFLRIKPSMETSCSLYTTLE
jgi:hypothetical protein